MPNVKDFYPGATAGNPINNAVDATNATVATTVDDQNAVTNAKVWTGTTAQYAAITPDADTLYFVTA
jgi:hypothetical protein